MWFKHFLCKVFDTMLSPEPPHAAKLEKGVITQVENQK